MTHVLASKLPLDCRSIIQEFLPNEIVERCYMCGLVLLMKDRRERLHLMSQHFVYTESVLVCLECFESFYV